MGDACLGLVMLHAFSDGSGAIAHGDHVDSADADGLKVRRCQTLKVHRELSVGLDRTVSVRG